MCILLFLLMVLGLAMRFVKQRSIFFSGEVVNCRSLSTRAFDAIPRLERNDDTPQKHSTSLHRDNPNPQHLIWVECFTMNATEWEYPGDKA